MGDVMDVGGFSVFWADEDSHAVTLDYSFLAMKFLDFWVGVGRYFIHCIIIMHALSSLSLRTRVKTRVVLHLSASFMIYFSNCDLAYNTIIYRHSCQALTSRRVASPS